MTLTANNLHLAGAGARWGVAVGIFLYMMIRPSEWDRVSAKTHPAVCPERARGEGDCS